VLIIIIKDKMSSIIEGSPLATNATSGGGFGWKKIMLNVNKTGSERTYKNI